MHLHLHSGHASVSASCSPLGYASPLAAPAQPIALLRPSCTKQPPSLLTPPRQAWLASLPPRPPQEYGFASRSRQGMKSLASLPVNMPALSPLASGLTQTSAMVPPPSAMPGVSQVGSKKKSCFPFPLPSHNRKHHTFSNSQQCFPPSILWMYSSRHE